MEDVHESVFALHYLGLVAFAQGDAARAAQLSRQSLAFFRAARMPWPAIEVLTVLALGEPTEASSLLEEALGRARERAQPEEVVQVHLGLGELAWRQGKSAEARSQYAQGVQRMQGRVLIPRVK